jgi:hypothetical protein
MSIFPSDFPSFALGIALGVIGAFGAGFLKKAGEECYSWIRNKVSPKPSEQHPAQVVIHVAGTGGHVASEEIAPSTLEPVSVKRVSSITVDDIREALDKAPPLQREHIANSYVGIRVEWDTYFKGGRPRDNDMVMVRLTTNFDRPSDTIWCEVPLSEYRELGVLPAGSKIRVSGKLTKADPWDIELEDVHLVIYQK